MKLTPGTHVGPYEIVDALGAGGMGEVFKARDRRLQRDVALKVITAARTFDVGSVTRFEREARAAAALNHPHIVAIYDVGSYHGSPFLISELLEGESLRQRTRRGPVPLRDALLWTAQAADALATAHSKGIVHRDIKPENLFVTVDGRLKILDFGLAKLVDAATDATYLAEGTPTASGTVLGTAGYMSPEQAAGQAVDHRSDIFSLGVVLYELVAGQRAFRGATAVETIAAIIKDDVVAPSALNPAVDAHLERIVMRCLEKLPDRRFQSARDLGFALTNAASESGGHPRAAPEARTMATPARPRAVLAATAIAAMAVGAAATLLVQPDPVVSSSGPKHFVVDTQPVPLSESLVPIALSPDGSTLAYTGGTQEGAQLYVRRLDSLSAVMLAGTLQAADPFFSPDGRWIAFRAMGQLRKVPVDGGPVETVATIGSLGSLGGTWASDGWIYYSFGTRVWRVGDGGGTPEPLTTLDPTRDERLHYWPQVLPSGKSLLVTVVTGPVEASRLAVVPIDGGPPRTLIEGGAFGRYLASGHVFYVQGTTGFVVPFDPNREVVTGDPRAVLENLATTNGAGARFAAADDGTVAFVQRSGAIRRSVMSVDRAGHAVQIDVPSGDIGGLAASPDERWLAIVMREGTTRNIWIRDQQAESTSQLTLDGTVAGPPVWRPDSRAVTYARRPGNVVEMVTQAIDGTRSAEVLWSSPEPMWPGSWSADGRQLFYMQSPGDLAVFDVGTTTSHPVLGTEATEWGARISPDGRWLAYVSNRTAVWEAYVRPWPGDGTPRRVSVNGGTEVVWRKDGRELFFRSDAGLMSAAVAPGSSFAIGEPRVALEPAPAPGQPGLPSYDVSRDGQRIFTVQRGEGEDARPPIHVIVDWLSPRSR